MIKKFILILMLGCVFMCASCSKKYVQLSDPKNGDPIAVFRTSMGDITVRLFPEYAPMTVENFTKLAESGYYDNVIFHRVINDFMIQSGDPDGTGMGGDSYFGGYFKDEVTPELHNIRGALSMANTGNRNTNGSQFFIVQNPDIGDDLKSIFNEALKDPEYKWADRRGGSYRLADYIPADFMRYYIDNGGTPHLDGPGLNTGYQHTVFGQVIEGMDTVDKIAAVPTTGNDDDPANKPLEDVIIYSIEISTYKK